jgi:hypothetical protein
MTLPEHGTPFILIAKQVHYYAWIPVKDIASIHPGPGTKLKVTRKKDGKWTWVDLHELQGAPPDRKPELTWHDPQETP